MRRFFVWKVLPFFLSLTAFLAIIFYTPPPPNWHQASIWQIIAILLCLLFSLLFFLNLFPLQFRYNSIISLTILLLIFLHSLGELDLTNTVVISILAFALIVVLGDFKLLKLPRSKKPVAPEQRLAKLPRSDRIKRLRRLSYLTNQKKHV